MTYVTHIATAIIFFFVGMLTVNLTKPDSQPIAIIEAKDPELYSAPVGSPEVNSDKTNQMSDEQIAEAAVADLDSSAIAFEYHLQLGTFRIPYFANTLVKKLKKRGYNVALHKIRIKGETLNLVEVGPFSKYNQIAKHKQLIESEHNSLGNLVIKKRIKK